MPFVPFPAQGEDPIKPDCGNKSTIKHNKHRAFCAGKKKPISSTQWDTVKAAINRIRAKGGKCAQLAGIADQLIARSDMVFFPRSSYAFNGAAPLGGGPTGPYSWMILDKEWVTKWYDPDHKTATDPTNPTGLTLQAALAHELDHLDGEEHEVDADGHEKPQLTKNTLACSDLT